jgi:error-prone DNA polymerase
MQAKGIALEFAQRVYKQIQGFGEYGFPESHAASFAIISYAAAYLRRHYPAEFICSLLNAQPMGFYSIATIVEDAKRLGVEMRPVDAQRSEWDCTLEMGAVRMGLRFVNGFGEADWGRLGAAREAAPSLTLTRPSLFDLARRTGLDKGALAALAEAGAFEALDLSRRSALWEVPGVVSDARLPLMLSPADNDHGDQGAHGDQRDHRAHEPVFPPLDGAETIAWDYQSSSHSVRGHPVAPLRLMLERQGFLDARTVQTLASGTLACCAGLVTCRQRPSTASNVTFMTLEDETGFVNLVLWERVFQAFSILARIAHWLGVAGTIESKDNVVHLIARRLWIPKGVPAPEHLRSRDFR